MRGRQKNGTKAGRQMVSTERRLFSAKKRWLRGFVDDVVKNDVMAGVLGGGRRSFLSSSSSGQLTGLASTASISLAATTNFNAVYHIMYQT